MVNTPISNNPINTGRSFLISSFKSISGFLKIHEKINNGSSTHEIETAVLNCFLFLKYIPIK